MSFLDVFAPRRAAPVARLDCPFCSGAAGGALCSVCHDEAMRAGRGHR